MLLTGGSARAGGGGEWRSIYEDQIIQRFFRYGEIKTEVKNNYKINVNLHI
jgi:hypothetical protein